MKVFILLSPDLRVPALRGLLPRRLASKETALHSGVGRRFMSATRLSDILSQIQGDSLPPVHLWNPDYCGAIDMVIHRDGSWSYMQSPISRARMVKLFSRVLRREGDGSFVLVTPVEKIGITVEDAPFVAVSAERLNDDAGCQVIVFETNVGDRVVAGPDHPLRVEVSETGEPRPYIKVRAGLEALISRSVFYDLVNWASPVGDALTLMSSGVSFNLGSTVEGEG